MRFCETTLWVIRLIVAAVLLSLLWVKFHTAPESASFFAKTATGRWRGMLSVIFELMALLLLFIPKATGWGALLLIIVITSAIFFRLSGTGVDIMDDGGKWFYREVIIWVGSAVLFITYRGQVLRILNRTLNRL